MKAERWQRIEEVFGTALDIPPDERAAFLRTVCGGDEALRREVEALLASHRRAGSFIQAPVFEDALTLIKPAEPALEKGHRIGPYEIIREIGRGGMGVVYLATRADDEYKKRIAIKLIKRGMDTEDILRRFRNERQILASLNHPNIARLLDGGTTEDGLPYFMMEYIEGLPLVEYCDAMQLPTIERLRLFRKICAAVQHAHQNLVVHRDLKPSNILVSSDGEPKLLDFGIAKFLNVEQSPQVTAQTATMMRLMTRDYASPEQVLGRPITTASDVYALGILLYKLLTGHHPYQFKTPLPGEVERVICETEPHRPSDAVSRIELVTTADGLSTQITPQQVSSARGSQPEKLRRALSGDLDNIVLMSLRKEPTRRYKSVEQFSEDIGRHLAGLPVIARKDTFTYRAGKFIARNQVAVAAAAIVLLAILTGLTVSIWQARTARRERAKAEAVSSFLQTMLLSSSPESALRRHKNEATVKDALDEASRRLSAGDLSEQPEVKAELQHIIGAAYLAQGRLDLAEQNLSSALEAKNRIYGQDNLETLKTRVLLAELWVDTGENAKAETFYHQNLPVLRAEQKEGVLSTDTVMTAFYNYALMQRTAGDSKGAEMLLREVLALSPRASPDLQANIGVTESVLALTLADQGEFDDAEKILRAKVTAIRQKNGGEGSGPSLCANLGTLGAALLGKGEFAEAEASLRESEVIYRKIYDPAYMPLGDNLRNQAQALASLRQYPEAEAKIDECLEIYRKTSNPQYINYATAIMIQGMIYSQTNRTAEAEKLLREAVWLRAENMPETHFLRAAANGELGEFLTAQKRFAEAAPLLLASYESLKRSQNPKSPRIRSALQRLVMLYENWGKADAAAEFRSKLS